MNPDAVTRPEQRRGDPGAPRNSRRVSLLAFARMGALVGAAVSLLPCLLFAVVGVMFVDWLGWLLESWVLHGIRINLGDAGGPMTLAQLLGLYDVHLSISLWQEHRLWTFAALWLVPWVVLTAIAALFAIFLALLYNLVAALSGGGSGDAIPGR